MKKSRAFFILTAMAASLMAAASLGAAEPDMDRPVSFYTEVISRPKHTTWYDDSNRQRSSNFPYPEFVPETDAFPALNAALDEISGGLKAMRDEYLSRRENGEEAYSYIENRLPEICREDSQLFSMLVYTNDPGNDHADTSRFYNIEPATGRTVELSEVLVTTDGLAEIIDSEARARDKYNQYAGNADDIRSSIADGTLRWGLGYDGLKVRLSFTGTNDGTYYYETTSDVTILFSEHPELFTSTYQVLPESYMIKMDPGRDYRLDLADDGSIDTVRFTEVEDSYGGLASVEAVINGTVTKMPFAGEDTTWFFDAVPYYVHPAMGASYFYVSLDGEDSDLMMGCYKAEGNALTELDVFRHGLRVQFQGCGTHFTDFAPYVSILSTTSARRCCTVGAGGWPVQVTDDYDISDANQTLVLKRDMTFDVVDGSPDADVTGSRTLPAGTKLNFWRTDRFSYVDLRIEAGDAYVRAYSEGGYPQTVNGMMAEDVFDGMTFAG